MPRPNRRLLGLSLILLATAVAVAGCSSRSDSGTLGGLDGFPAQHGLQARFSPDQQRDALAQAYVKVEGSMSKWVYIGEAKDETPGAMSGDLDLLWQPNGARDTSLPPSPKGQRIYAVVIPLDRLVTGQPPIARVAFMTREQGDAWNRGGTFDPNAIQTPPDLKVHEYSIPSETLESLIDLFYRRV